MMLRRLLMPPLRRACAFHAVFSPAPCYFADFERYAALHDAIDMSSPFTLDAVDTRHILLTRY